MLYDDLVPDLRYFVCRHCTPAWNMRHTTISFIDLTYVFGGHGAYTVNGTRYACGPGDLICVPRGGTRQGRVDPQQPMRLYACNLQLTDLKGQHLPLPFPPHIQIGLREDLLDLYRDINTAWVRKRPGYRILVRALLLQILHIYFTFLFDPEHTDHANAHVQKALRLLHEQFAEKISVVGLARHVGLNPSYFGTLFREETGTCVQDYLNRIRADHAENLLISGGFSIKEVAVRCGFDDAFYFSKVFKRYKGVPPSHVISPQ